MNLLLLKELAGRAGVQSLLAALGDGQARLVGGAVRDSLLGLPVTDIDLATTLSPYEVMRRCGAASIRTVPTGIAHGTVTALAEGEALEVTTLRADLHTDGRHATVAFTDNWREDAARRDFTVNALYYDPATGQVSDWFGGLQDLQAGRVRFIGEPLTRIAEDHLRILRFFRFTARFGQAADPEGLAACTERANDLMALSRERIADEWLKLLGLPDPQAIVALMLERDILRPVLPEVQASALSALQVAIEAERRAGIAPDPLRRFAALLPPDPTLAEKAATRLKLGNKARKRLALTVDRQLGSNPHTLAYAIGVAEAQDRLLLAGQAEQAASLTGWEVPKLAIGGGALVARGLSPGPIVAATLKAVERRWVEEGFPGPARVEQIVAEALGGKA